MAGGSQHSTPLSSGHEVTHIHTKAGKADGQALSTLEEGQTAALCITDSRPWALCVQPPGHAMHSLGNLREE